MDKQTVPMEKCSTGINGFDQLLGGGLPKGTSIIVSGGPGSGKTIFLSQFLYNGIRQYDEPGIFVTFQEKPESIRKNMLTLGLNLEEVEKQNKLAFLDLSDIAFLSSEFHKAASHPKVREFTAEGAIASIRNVLQTVKAKRLAIDGVTTLFLYESEQAKIRRNVAQLFQRLLKMNCTCLISSETRTSTFGREFQIEDYLADGVILLRSVVKGSELQRTIHVMKMRGISHDTQPHPYHITGNGIVVFPKEISL